MDHYQVFVFPVRFHKFGHRIRKYDHPYAFDEPGPAYYSDHYGPVGYPYIMDQDDHYSDYKREDPGKKQHSLIFTEIIHDPLKGFTVKNKTRSDNKIEQAKYPGDKYRAPHMCLPSDFMLPLLFKTTG